MILIIIGSETARFQERISLQGGLKKKCWGRQVYSQTQNHPVLKFQKELDSFFNYNCQGCYKKYSLKRMLKKNGCKWQV
jgi:hypothetical protein